MPDLARFRAARPAHQTSAQDAQGSLALAAPHAPNGGRAAVRAGSRLAMRDEAGMRRVEFELDRLAVLYILLNIQ
ncbi:hypothetical protein GCM10017643_40690 [Ancylobacter dichloromethanicus]|uniref:Uncharacterized protein n=1 Tax=Ancylobacter dichloromethanicus TaxID=518825 RepID=A0A9W6JAI8_9HYPH|nr:hypothetical protein GCM10017643_40690 [Ancylobacter dichloromethanicus]